MKIYCFGNEFIKGDSMAREICSELNGFEFVKIDNVLDFVEMLEIAACKAISEHAQKAKLFDNKDSKLVIMDVVRGITRPRLFVDLDEFETRPENTHDLDLGFFLKLLKEIKKEKKVWVIGIPRKGDKKLIKQGLKKILNRLSAAATA